MDDRRFLEDVASGRTADPCSYRCWAEGCTASTGYQPDKTETGMRRLAEGERTFLRALTGKFVGSYTCPTHSTRLCQHCWEMVAWWDGPVCDYCDRYTDEEG